MNRRSDLVAGLVIAMWCLTYVGGIIFLGAFVDRKLAVVFACPALWLLYMRLVPTSIAVWTVLIGPFILLGLFLGSWRVPVVATAALVLWVLRVNYEPDNPEQVRTPVKAFMILPNPGRLRTTVEFILYSLIGAVLGSFAYGVLGGFIGCVTGLALRLVEGLLMRIEPRRGKTDSGPNC